MACESDKCEKYGLHHDFKDGIEIRKCFACARDERLIEYNEMAWWKGKVPSLAPSLYTMHIKPLSDKDNFHP
jgi:hypothetical protein